MTAPTKRPARPQLDLVTYERKPLKVAAIQLTDEEQVKKIATFINYETSPENAQGAFINQQGRLTVEPGHTPVVAFHQGDGSPAVLQEGDWLLRTDRGSFWHAKEADFARDFAPKA